MKINIEIDNITLAQKIAIEDLLAQWQFFGNVGMSRWTAFFSDGDGNFHPKIKIDNQEAKLSEFDNKERWQDNSLGKIYCIDFDEIAWKLRGNKEKIYDQQISPLMSQIISICREHKIAALCSFALGFDKEIDSELYCTTALLEKECEPPQELKQALDIIKKPEMFTFTITKE